MIRIISFLSKLIILFHIIFFNTRICLIFTVSHFIYCFLQQNCLFLCFSIFYCKKIDFFITLLWPYFYIGCFHHKIQNLNQKKKWNSFNRIPIVRGGVLIHKPLKIRGCTKKNKMGGRVVEKCAKWSIFTHVL